MATLIAAYNSSGCIGRCDANCYEATTPECTCICGGANHGVGLKKATENVLSYSKERIKEIEAQGGYVSPEVKQLTLL